MKMLERAAGRCAVSRRLRARLLRAEQERVHEVVHPRIHGRGPCCLCPRQDQPHARDQLPPSWSVTALAPGNRPDGSCTPATMEAHPQRAGAWRTAVLPPERRGRALPAGLCRLSRHRAGTALRAIRLAVALARQSGVACRIEPGWRLGRGLWREGRGSYREYRLRPGGTLVLTPEEGLLEPAPVSRGSRPSQRKGRARARSGAWPRRMPPPSNGERLP